MYKLRLAVLGPAIVVMVVLGVIGFAQPHLIPLLTFALPAIGTTSIVTVLLMERVRKRRNSSPNTSSAQVH